MVADDSSVARKQVERALKTLGLEAVLVTNGQEAFDILKEMSKEGSIYAFNVMKNLSQDELTKAHQKYQQ